MSKDGNKGGQSYEILKQRLWNQPRTRQILEHLEKLGAPPSMLEAAAKKFATGLHGGAEIDAAIYCELLRNRDTKTILKRVAALRSAFVEIRQDLFHITSEIHQLKVWDSYKNFGDDQWSEFAREVLGLSDKVVDALLIAREETPGQGLDGFIQAMIKGYALPSPPLQKKDHYHCRSVDPTDVLRPTKSSPVLGLVFPHSRYQFVGAHSHQTDTSTGVSIPR